MAKKNKVGRPKIELTAKQIKEVEELASYLTISQIADYLGICEDTFHEIKKRDNRVFRVYKKGRAKAVRHVSGKLHELIDSGDPSATMLFLKTQAGWSSDSSKNQSIYDPFGGSGTTLIACEKSDRNCYMMELSPAYIDVIIARWQKETGKEAILHEK